MTPPLNRRDFLAQATVATTALAGGALRLWHRSKLEALTTDD